MRKLRKQIKELASMPKDNYMEKLEKRVGRVFHKVGF